jgi:type II secretory pathway predicted ATPase ExeA
MKEVDCDPRPARPRPFRSDVVWKRYWNLSADPFLGPGGPYVRTPGHDEAVARLVDAVETGQKVAVLRGAEGVGKSCVLARALGEVRHPKRRVSRSRGAFDGVAMAAALAEGLGVKVGADAGRRSAWKALADAVRLCRWQSLHAVLAVDDCQLLTHPDDVRDLERLSHLDPNPAARLTVLLSFRDPEIDDPGAPGWSGPSRWEPEARVPAMTRSETVRFVAERLAAAGRTEPGFSRGALARLHDLTGGVPRGVERLGSLALMAGALGGSPLVTPEVVDGVARECAPSWAGFAA